MKRIGAITFLLLMSINYVYAQKPTQKIRGNVYDAETMEKLPGANIILQGSDYGAISEMDGYFQIDMVEVGRYNLQVSFIGYEPLVIPELLLGSGKELVLNVALKRSILVHKDIIVKADIHKDRPVNSMSSVSARTFSVEEARRYAGALDDPGRMAGNFAGVSPVAAHQNAIVVRGNAPKGLLWILEGVDIPAPSHFSGSNITGGGGLTIFSSQLLANSDFYTGAFPTEFSNASAGVFDIKLRNGNNERYEYAFQVGVQGIEMAAEGPIKDGSGSSFLLNYRYSTMALIFPLLPEVKDANELPVYQDLSFKIHIPTRKAGHFSIWGVGGLSESSMKGYDAVERWIYPENRKNMQFSYDMGVMGIGHILPLAAKSHIRTNIAISAGIHQYREDARLSETTPSELHPLFSIES
ncbi:MAG TPA: carboxypeptidase-like regulatory domain-containing protein [Candidatus Marinimicrobia bacterium]|nr:carboxypeptidase-like regulatory domain-containing protein [Candidatus Neomarinimicrobiota bacterium]